LIGILLNILIGINLLTSADRYYIPEETKIIREGINILFDDIGDSAIAHFEQLYSLDIEEQVPYFYSAMVYEFLMDKYRTTVYDSLFYVKIDSSIIKGEKIYKQGNWTAKTLLYLGGAYGMRGVRRAVVGDWKGAFTDGQKAHSILHECIEVDSEMYDVYFGLGQYHYWKSVKVNLVRKYFPLIRLLSPFVDLFKNERESGLQEIELCIEKGQFAGVYAKHAFIRVYLEEKRYKEALVLTKEFQTDFPNDLFCLWYGGLALVGLNRWSEALDIYTKLEQILSTIDYRGIEADVECWYSKALCLYHLNRLPEAMEYAKRVQHVQEKVNPRIFFYENYIESNAKLLEILNEKLMEQKTP